MLAAAVAVTGLLGLFAYAPVFAWLFDVWISNPYYSHGLLLVPVILAVAWVKRDAFQKAPQHTDALGLLGLALGGGLFVAGRGFSSNYLQAWSLLPLIAGTVWFLHGRKRTRTMAWPLGMLTLVLPIPFQEWLFGPLQEAATIGAAGFSRLMGLDVTYSAVTLTVEGNTFAVVPLCAGLSSTLSLFAITGLALLLWPTSKPSGAGVFALVLPIALFSNMLRIVSTVSLAAWKGPETGLSFFHSGGALVLYAVGLGTIGGVVWAARRLDERLFDQEDTADATTTGGSMDG